MSPRIGILGQSTFPSEHDHYMSQSNIGGTIQNSNQSINLGNNKIDDVSSSVNKQIRVLEDQLVTGYDLLQLFKEEAD
jgi:hypothetical protein